MKRANPAKAVRPVQEAQLQLRLWVPVHAAQLHPPEHDFLVIETDLLAVDVTTPREKTVENAEELRGAAMASTAARMGVENFMVV